MRWKKNEEYGSHFILEEMSLRVRHAIRAPSVTSPKKTSEAKGAVTLCNISCNLFCNALRDKLHEALHSVTAP